MSTLSFALVIVAIILLTCLTVNVVNQQKEYATTATLGLGAVAVGALAVSNMDSLKSGGVPNIKEAQRIIDEWNPWDRITRGELNLAGLELEELPDNLPNNLERLNCSNNNLKSLSNLPPGLTFLNCSMNPLESLPDPLPEGLETLYCIESNLKTLPQLPSGLTTLVCANNQIHCLPVLPKSLQNLTCTGNPIIYPEFNTSRRYMYGEGLDELRDYMKRNERPEDTVCNPPTS
jgi:Leucine-rich repeat (LRR) protein